MISRFDLYALCPGRTGAVGILQCSLEDASDCVARPTVLHALLRAGFPLLLRFSAHEL